MADEAPPEDSGPGWVCRACGTDNSLELDICRACETSIYDAFGASDTESTSVAPSTGATWALLPGGGHFKVGQAPLGIAVAGLITSSLLFGVLMVGGSRRPVGIVLLIAALLAWGISAYDAARLAGGSDDILLKPRVITVAMGVIFTMVIVAAFSLGGAAAP